MATTASSERLHRVQLPAGPLDYLDSGGDGPVLVLLHGLPMDGGQWRDVVPLLDGYRVVRPTLPIGAHHTPMHPHADLSQAGIAHIVADLLDALDLRDVTLVMNDWGGGQFVVSEGRADRVARMVLVACEAFDNFPPGSARQMAAVMKVLPGASWLMFAAHRLGPVRRMRGGYGSMAAHGIPDDLMDDWFGPGRRDAGIRRDFHRFATTTPDAATLLEWAERCRAFTGPVLVVWATEDRFMPREHGPRLAAHYPDARLVEIDDAATLVPLDQPERLAEAMLAFLAETGAPPARPSA